MTEQQLEEGSQQQPTNEAQLRTVRRMISKGLVLSPDSREVVCGPMKNLTRYVIHQSDEG